METLRTLFHAVCRKCNRLILLGPEDVKCPHCGWENQVLDPDGTKVQDLPR